MTFTDEQIAELVEVVANSTGTVNARKNVARFLDRQRPSVWALQSMQYEKFLLQLINVCFYAPISWKDDEENQRIHDALAAEAAKFRAVAQDLVDGIVPAPHNEEIAIAVRHS